MTAAFVGPAFCELPRNAFAYAYAFPAGGTGHVGVHLWPTDGPPGVRAYLLVADDGRGFGAEPPAASGRGIPPARGLVERCGGAPAREPGGKGTVWRAMLPRAAGGARPQDAVPGARPDVSPVSGRRRPEASRPGRRRGTPGGT